MCVEESIHIIFNESDFNPSKQVDDFELIWVRPNEKYADSIIEEEELIKEEKNEEENLQNNVVYVAQDNGIVHVPTKNENVEGTASTMAKRGTNEQGSSSCQKIKYEQPVPIREFQPKPSRQQKSHPVELIISDNQRYGNYISVNNFCAFHVFLLMMELRNHEEALTDSD